MASDDLNKSTNDLKSHDNLLGISLALAFGLTFFNRRLSCISAGFGGFLHGKRSTLLEKQKESFDLSQKSALIKKSNPYLFWNSHSADKAINLMSTTSTALLTYYETSAVKKEIDCIIEKSTSSKKP